MRSDWYGGECFSFESKRGGGCLSLNYDDTNTVRMLRTETRTCSDGGMDMKTYRLSAISKTINRSEKLSTTRSVKSADERARRNVGGPVRSTAGRRMIPQRRRRRWRRRETEIGAFGDAVPEAPYSTDIRSVGRSVSRSVCACMLVHARGKKLLETPGRRGFVAYFDLKTTTMKSADHILFFTRSVIWSFIWKKHLDTNDRINYRHWD